MTREALLNAAADNNLWRETDGTSILTDLEYLGSGEIIAVVTDECEQAEKAGLIRTRPVLGNAALGFAWELTHAGRLAHAANKAGAK